MNDIEELKEKIKKLEERIKKLEEETVVGEKRDGALRQAINILAKRKDNSAVSEATGYEFLMEQFFKK